MKNDSYKLSSHSLSNVNALSLRRMLAYAIYKLGGSLIFDKDYDDFAKSNETHIYTDKDDNWLITSNKYNKAGDK